MRDIKEIEARYSNKPPKYSIKIVRKRYFVILILLIAILTNPSESKHRQAVASKINSALYDPSSLEIDGHEVVDSSVGHATQSYVSSSNYFLFSTTEVKWNGQTHTIGVGVFGKVFLSGAVDQYLKRRTR